MKKFLSVLLTLIMICGAVYPASYAVSAASYADSLRSAGFPESYIDSLVELHGKYPKWTFKVFHTGVKWQDAVDGERAVTHSQQVIEKVHNNNYYCSCSKCKKNGTYVIQLSPNWVCASEAALKYYMDPRNWLDAKHIFQFESTAYSSTQTQAGVEAILKPTWMYKSAITYKNTEGNTKTYKKNGTAIHYSDAVMQAAKNSGMSPYYLASKIVQEVGSSTSSYAGGSCGTRDPFKGIYNYYNIGAYSNASNGLEWASGFTKTNKKTVLYTKYDSTAQKGTGSQINVDEGHYCCWMGNYGYYYKVKLYTYMYNKEKKKYEYIAGYVGYVLKDDIRTKYFNYGRPWTNPYKTIYYGAEYIEGGYADYQYTGYLQKFNVNSKSPSLYAHEYTTTVEAPKSESEKTYKAYNAAGILDDAHTFYIPVFSGMPSKKCTVPTPSDETTSTTSPSETASLTLDARTQETMTLSWKKQSGADKYELSIQNKTKGTSFGKTVTTHSATIKGLTPANEYYIRVRAHKSSGWTSYFAKGTYHALPPKVTGAKQTAKTATTVTVSWNKVSGADGYTVYQYHSSTKKYTKLASVSGATSKKITNLTPGTVYTLAVAAYTKDTQTKTGAKSAKVSAYTKPKKVPIKSATSPSSGKIKVTWSKPTGGVSGYQIVWYRDSKFKTKAAEKILSGSKTVTYMGKGFTKGRTYYVRVRAYKTVDGKKIYGAFSDSKKVKCK